MPVDVRRARPVRGRRDVERDLDVMQVVVQRPRRHQGFGQPDGRGVPQGRAGCSTRWRPTAQADRDGQETSIRDYPPAEGESGFRPHVRGGQGERRFEPRHCIGHPLDELLIRVVPAVRVI